MIIFSNAKLLKYLNTPGLLKNLEGIMSTEEEIKKLAYSIWEKEGRPQGRDVEHYFKAQKIIESPELPPVIELPPPVPFVELPPPKPVQSLSPPVKKKMRNQKKKK